MKRALLERNLVVILFVLVLVVFSFAERDSKKLEKIYSASALLKKASDIILSLNTSPKPQTNQEVN